MKIPMQMGGAVATGTITKASGVSGTLGETTCYKVGNVVNVCGYIYDMTNQVASGTFMMIPEGFRPRVLTQTNGFIVVDGTFVPYIIKITTAGEVRVSYSGSKQAVQIFFAGTYPI